MSSANLKIDPTAHGAVGLLNRQVPYDCVLLFGRDPGKSVAIL